jgi:hypothetical protein
MFYVQTWVLKLLQSLLRHSNLLVLSNFCVFHANFSEEKILGL